MIFIDQPAQVGFSYSVPVPGMYIRSDPILVGAENLNRNTSQKHQREVSASFICLIDFSSYAILDFDLSFLIPNLRLYQP